MNDVVSRDLHVVLRDLACAPPDLDALMRLAVDLVPPLLRADAATISLVDGDELVCACASGLFAGAEGLRTKIDKSFGGACLVTGVPLICPDAHADDRVDGVLADRLGVRSIIGMPLIRDGQRIGLLGLGAREPGVFTEAAGERLQLIGDVVSSRLDYARAQAMQEESHRLVSSMHQRQAAVFEALEDGVVVQSRDGVVQTSNAAAWRLLGLTKHQLHGLEAWPPSWRAIHEDGTEFPPSTFPAREALETGRRIRNRTMGIVLPEGGVRWLRCTAVPLVGEDGAYVAVARFSDVTERHRQLADLAASERRFRLTVEMSPIGMAIVAPTGEFLQANKALSQLVGYDEKVLCDMTFQDITHPDDLDVDLALVGELLRGERDDYHLEKRYLHSAGHEVWIDLTVGLVRDAEGLPLHFIAQITDASVRKATEAELARQATTDPLTGLPNRRRWHEALAEAAELVAAGRPVTLAIADVDHFKRYNDTHGHAAGDALLRGCSTAWSQRLRRGDTVARLGGEEFGVVLMRTDTEAALGVLEALRAEVPDGQTVSVGMTQLLPGEDPQIAFERADRALYQAKEAGRDRVVLR